MSDSHRKAVVGWCLYDWANSAFTTLVVTFVYATFFTQAFAEDEGAGTSLWSNGIVVSSLLVALLSPIFGAMADRGGRRLFFLGITTVVCVLATSGLAFISPSAENVFWALSIFVIGNVAFEMGMVFYNAFLPAIVPAQKIGRVSGYGWAAGYGGGLVCLVVALLGFIGVGGAEPWLDLSQEGGFHVRATNLLVAAWFLVFSLPMFFWVREPEGGSGSLDLRGALGELKETFRKIRAFREVVKFLLARLIYNDGLITIFAFGGIYAAGTFGMEYDEVIVFGVALNVAAGLGALAFGFIDDKVGGKATVLLSLIALSAATLLAVLAPNKTWFWIAGLTVGIFAGPNQSASRSLMGRFVPERHQAEFFGFFAFSGKASAFLGPLLLGILSAEHGQRAGVSTVLVFFVIGGALLLNVDEKRGIAAARDA